METRPSINNNPKWISGFKFVQALLCVLNPRMLDLGFTITIGEAEITREKETGDSINKRGFPPNYSSKIQDTITQ